MNKIHTQTHLTNLYLILRNTIHFGQLLRQNVKDLHQEDGEVHEKRQLRVHRRKRFPHGGFYDESLVHSTYQTTLIDLNGNKRKVTEFYHFNRIAA